MVFVPFTLFSFSFQAILCLHYELNLLMPMKSFLHTGTAEDIKDLKASDWILQAKRFEHLFQRDILSIFFHCHPLIEWWKLAMVSAPKDASTCLPHCGEHCSKECDDKGHDEFTSNVLMWESEGIRGSVMSCRVRFLPRQDGKMC